MKRTLLAVGFAILVSMMFVPYGGTNDHRNWNDKFGMFVRSYYSFRSPFFVDSQGYPILLPELIVQTTFLAVAAAVIVNLFPRRPKQ